MALITPTYTCTVSINGATPIPVASPTTPIYVPESTTANVTINFTSPSAGACTYNFKAPPTTLFSNSVPITGKSFPAAISSTQNGVTVPITVAFFISQAANGTYAATTNVPLVTLTAAPSPTLTPNAHNGTNITAAAGATYSMSATTSPSVALTYSLAPGYPAGGKIDPSTGIVTLGAGAGTYSGIVNYGGSATVGPLVNASAGSFTALDVPTIKAIPAQTVVYSSTASTVALSKPSSPSNGAFTWSKISGPGSVDPTTGVVTLNGTTGTVLVGVTQAANGAYLAVTTVQQVAAITVLVAPSITTGSAQTVTWSPTQTVDAHVAANASPGAYHYSIKAPASGATVDGSGKVSLANYVIPVTGQAGPITVLVSQDASGSYTAITNATAAVITVNPAVPTISPRTLSTAYNAGSTYNFASTAISNSSGTLTYQMSGGPNGSVVASNGVVTLGAAVGKIYISVTQAASGNYAAITNATAAGSLEILPIAPVLTAPSGAAVPKTVTGAFLPSQSVDMSVNSTSPGLLTYSLASGAPTGTTINPSTGTVGVGGLGTVVVKVSQEISANYSSLSGVTVGTIISTTGAPTITKQPYQTLNYSPELTITPQASSTSPGALTYAVASGPGVMSADGLSLTVSGTGTIVVYAVQQASTPFTALSASDKIIAGTYNIVFATVSAAVAFKSPTYLGNTQQLYMSAQDQLVVQPSKLAILTRTYSCALSYLPTARATLSIGSTPYTPKNAVAYPNVYLFRKPTENNDQVFSTLQCQYYGVRDANDLKQVYTTTGSEVRTVTGEYTLYGSGTSSTNLTFTAKYVSPVITQSWVQYSSAAIVPVVPQLPYNSAGLFDVVFTNVNLTGTNVSNAPVPLNSLISQLGSLNQAVASIPGLKNSANFSIQNTSPTVSLIPEVVSIDSTNYGTVSEVTVKYGAAISSGLTFS